MFAVVNRLRAIPGYSYGIVVSVHATELDALTAESRLRRCSRRDGRDDSTSLYVLPLAVRRNMGQHVRLSDLADTCGDTQYCNWRAKSAFAEA